jgi:hypothetical protein
MKPDVANHFADRVALIGVNEGPWWRHSTPVEVNIAGRDPDGLAVRLDDGTRAYVVGRCKSKPTFTRTRGRWEHGLVTARLNHYLLWADQGLSIIVAIHEHRADELLWRDVRELHAPRSAVIDGEPHVFFDRDVFHVAPCGAVRA